LEAVILDNIGVIIKEDDRDYVRIDGGRGGEMLLIQSE
jgi:hypothetical protein